MRKIFITCVFLLILNHTFAQNDIPVSKNEEQQTQILYEKPRPEWMNKLRYGGNIWLGFFGTFYIDASPMIGYDLNDKGTVAGLGATFIFQGTFNRNSSSNSNSTIFGPKVFVRQQIYRSFYAHAEYEFVNAYADQFYSYIPDLNNPSAANKKVWGSSPLLGIGFYQGGGGNRGSFITLMYNMGYPNRGFISPQSLLGSQTPITLRYGFLF